jgi:hypothetical protein
MKNKKAILPSMRKKARMKRLKGIFRRYWLKCFRETYLKCSKKNLQRGISFSSLLNA